MTDPLSPQHRERRLRDLERVAANVRWSWHRSAAELLAGLPGADGVRHPSAVVSGLVGTAPAALAAFIEANDERIGAEAAEVDGLQRSTSGPVVAYFSPEFGLAAQLPQYSGGLGILAGDHLKAASDLGVALVGVGLFYREGFFRQDIVEGRQIERNETVDPRAVGAADTGATVTVEIEGETVTAAVRELWVGATRLLLLDTDIEANTDRARSITDRLYAGDRRHRLSQELVLGLGGVRALRALGCDVAAYHLNEGHACFGLLELVAERVEAGAGLDDAVASVRSCTLFTTHTPVPAGIDRFDPAMVEPELAPLAGRLGVGFEVIADWATLPSDGHERPFNTAALAFALCGRANGVSQLHAVVSRELFSSLPTAPAIDGLTNGVHARTWVDPRLQDLYDGTLGKGWENGDDEAWSLVSELDRDRFCAIADQARRELVELVLAATGRRLDPDRPIIGFARRFATYKRAALLLGDPEGFSRLLDQGAQFVFAGKAHPADEAGKAVLASVSAAARDNAGLVVVPGYDIDVARALYSGSDVWLNTPVRPHEACGTSGEKAALNGALNCSILDGWWADWFRPGIGWEIPTVDDPDPARRDRVEAVALNALLGDRVLPVVSGRGDPWWEMVTVMLAHLGPLVTAGRMVAEYDRRFYHPIRTT